MTEEPERLASALADRYRIERQLGEGGMATVYLAQDLKHDRQVAIKVLRPELAAVLGAERFVQEIKTTAHLQHPNILPLFDSGEADGFLYYVMPYIAGETLRDKLNREKQLGIDEAVKITTEVAEALDYAHRQDVIHRDIKPENILLHDGRPLVADFGIALAVSAAAGGRMTETGLSLGTPHYMSPEQATAEKDITGRSDVYSLGAVLYEMLTGDPPHTGSTAQQVIAKIVADEPRPVSQLRRTVPRNVAAVVGKALEKLPADRFPTAHDLVHALNSPQAAVAAIDTHDRQHALPWALTLLSLVVAGFAIWSPWSEESPARPVATFVQTLDPGQSFVDWPGSPIALSRDGRQLVYAVREKGTTRLYHRPLDQAEPTPLAGTDGATAPFFSPDGRWVAFFAGGRLKKVSLAGGAPQTVADADGPRTGSWGGDGTIVVGSSGNLEKFAPRAVYERDLRASATAVTRGGLSAVPASGGSLQPLTEPLTDPEQHHETHHWPHVLPDGQSVLLTVYHGPGWEREQMGIAALSLETGEVNKLVEPGTFARYMSGYIVYAWAGDLLAVPFDAANLRVTGTPVPVADGVQMYVTGSALFDVADNGSLVYVPGQAQPFTRSLAWIDTDGRVEPLALDAKYYQSPRIAPSGNRLLVSEDYGRFVVHDLVRGTKWGLSDGAGAEFWAVWSPDGETVVFNSTRAMREPGDNAELFRTAPSGSIPPELLLYRPLPQTPQAITPDQRQLIFAEGVLGESGFDIWMLPLEGDREPAPLIQTPANEFHPALSPDGRWIAYASDASGQTQVYVRPFPALSPIFVASPGGGREPVWSPSGRVLYYRSNIGNEVFAAPVMARGSTLVIGSPRSVATGTFAATEPWGRNYDIAPDGERLLMIMEAEPIPVPTRFGITLNWVEALKARAGT